MSNKKYLLRAESDTLQYTGVKLLNPHPFEIAAGKTYVIIGEMAQGKPHSAKSSNVAGISA